MTGITLVLVFHSESQKDMEELDNLDFTEVAKELEVLERENPNSEILTVLKEGRALDSYKKALAEDLHKLESLVVNSYLSNSDSLLDLYHETRKCDALLGDMESVLADFSNNLRGVSDDIRQLQFKSQQLSTQLRVQTESQSKVTDFLNAVIISPDVVSTIFEEEDCGSDKFVHAISVLSKQIREHSRLDQTLPAALESAPELVKLKNKANYKIREYLITKINSLKKSGTNIHMIQRNVLTKARKLMRFLKMSEPALFSEISSYYIATVSRIFSSQFKQYVHALAKLSVEPVGGKTDLVGLEPPAPHIPTAPSGAINDIMKFSSGVFGGNNHALSPSGGGLDGRDKVFTELDSEAIVVAAMAGDTTPSTTPSTNRNWPESLLRSHQKLLADTVANEYLFLLDFFDLHRPQSPSSAPEDRIEKYFESIFGGISSHGSGKILPWFTDHITTGSIRDSYDVFGLILSQTVLEHFQDVMINKRKIAVLDSYFENLVSQIRARIRLVLDMHADSLKRYDVKKSPVVGPTTVAAITRRFTDFFAGILKAKSKLLEGDNKQTEGIEKAFDTVLTGLAKRNSGDISNVFLINNYAHVVAGLKRVAMSADQWEVRLNAATSAFIEKQLTSISSFSTMIKLTLEGEKTPTSPRSSTVDLERCVLNFQSNWKSDLEKLRTMNGGFIPPTGDVVFKSLCTQLLLYYTRFQKVVVTRTGSLQTQPAWVKQIVPSAVVMAEIKSLTN